MALTATPAVAAPHHSKQIRKKPKIKELKQE
jgi:hypothetical protein